MLRIRGSMKREAVHTICSGALPLPRALTLTPALINEAKRTINSLPPLFSECQAQGHQPRQLGEQRTTHKILRLPLC